TKRDATGFLSFPPLNPDQFSSEEECAAELPEGETPTPFCGLPLDVREAARMYANGAIIPVSATLNDDHWLPSLNLKLEVSEGLQFRAAFFKGIAPPDFGLTRYYYNVGLSANAEDIEAGGGLPMGRINAGNPLLRPVVSDNFDLTAEWYFSEVGQLSFAAFYKELKGIRTNDIQRTTFTNNGASFDAIVTTAVNSEETGKIKGFEVAYQQTYDFLPSVLGGLGLAANYTYVDSSNVPQSTLSETDPHVAAGNQTTVDISKLPLQGLSRHTVHFAPSHAPQTSSAPRAYWWRDAFLPSIRDVIVPFQPIMHQATGQLDGSIFFSVSYNWKVGLQGVHRLRETLRTSAIVNDELQT